MPGHLAERGESWGPLLKTTCWPSPCYKIRVTGRKYPLGARLVAINWMDGPVQAQEGDCSVPLLLSNLVGLLWLVLLRGRWSHWSLGKGKDLIQQIDQLGGKPAQRVPRSVEQSGNGAEQVPQQVPGTWYG